MHNLRLSRYECTVAINCSEIVIKAEETIELYGCWLGQCFNSLQPDDKGLGKELGKV